MGDFNGPGVAISTTPSPTSAEAQFPYAAEGLLPGTHPPVPEREPDEPTGRFRPGPVLLAGTATLVAVAIVVVWLVWGPSMNPFAPVAGANAPPASSAVTAYLKAVAAGDAATALGLGATDPGNAELLTAEVLTASPTRISDIEVPAVSNHPASQQVTASYRIGSQPVTAEFNVFRTGEVWRLGAAVARVDLTSLGFADLPITVNGALVTDPLVSLLPGQYLIGTTHPRYRVEHPEVTVLAPGVTPDLSAVRLALSDQAIREITEAATDQLLVCLDAPDLSPDGCGFEISQPPNVRLIADTLRWEVSSGGDTLTNQRPALIQPGTATAKIALTIHGEVEGSDGSLWQVSVTITQVHADLTGRRVKVEFS